MAKRHKWSQWGPKEKRHQTTDSTVNQLISWNKAAEKTNRRRRVFINSLSDVFDLNAPIGARDKIFAYAGKTPMLDYLLLTKRPENFKLLCPADLPANMWLGVTVGLKSSAHRIDLLKQTKAKVKFVSAEPLLEDLSNLDFSGVDWLILGGESGFTKQIRRTVPEHFDRLMESGQEKGIPLFFKQTGTVLAREMKLTDASGGILQELPEKWQIRQYPKVFPEDS